MYRGAFDFHFKNIFVSFLRFAFCFHGAYLIQYLSIMDHEIAQAMELNYRLGRCL